MNEFESSVKDKRWRELKTAVGTMVSQRDFIGRRMTIDDILLNIKAVGFDSLVCQKDIVTEEDKETYARKGYRVHLTAEEFQERFDLDPGYVWYTPSISQETLYFNPETLAAAPFHLDFILSGIAPGVDRFYETIDAIEEQVAKHDYMHAIMALPDAMQLEYFNKLVEKKGADVPGLYDLFFSFYTNSDYGFGNIEPATLKAVLGAKGPEDRARTAEALVGLPDVLKVYRGGNTASTPYKEAYSWTLDSNVAVFFACRRGKDEGYVVEAEVDKKDIIDAFLDDRNEQEIIVGPDKVRVTQEVPMHGMRFLEDVLPKVMPMYHKYLERLMELEFAQDSVDHGYGHEARVMLLSLIIAEKMNLSLRDQEVLATAALYHDLQRVNDIDDEQHGYDGKEFYHNTMAKPDPLVEFLCEYHCLPDEEGYREIRNNRRLSRDRSRAKMLIDIFKDADALDRCRFGLRDLDWNQLRLDVSKKLPLSARICYEQVKLPERQFTPKIDHVIAKARADAESSPRENDRLCDRVKTHTIY